MESVLIFELAQFLLDVHPFSTQGSCAKEFHEAQVNNVQEYFFAFFAGIKDAKLLYEVERNFDFFSLNFALEALTFLLHIDRIPHYRIDIVTSI